MQGTSSPTRPHPTPLVSPRGLVGYVRPRRPGVRPRLLLRSSRRSVALPTEGSTRIAFPEDGLSGVAGGWWVTAAGCDQPTYRICSWMVKRKLTFELASLVLLLGLADPGATKTCVSAA